MPLLRNRENIVAFYSSLLYLKEFRCVVETEEWGDDSPYFVIFVGNLSQGLFTDVVRLRMPAWDNSAHSGKLFTPNLWAHNHVDTHSVVLVALVEEDDDADIGTDQLATLKLLMNARFSHYSSWNLTLPQRASLMAEHFKTYLKDLLNSDEYIQTRHLPISANVGDLPLLNFFGDGGHYRVRFKMVDTQG